MKKYLFFVLLLASFATFAQPGKKPKPQPAQQDMNKLIEEALKNENMSEAEKAEMRKLMKGVTPALNNVNATMADYPEFTDNKQLIPKRDVVRIAALSKKTLTKTDIGSYSTGLYNKLIAKGNATEITLAKKIMAQTPNANDIGKAAVLCMMQGHPEAAMALSMKAVQMEPTNANWQNNMASLLTQYGYPEQAIPVLNKLKNELPQNSTVFNNLAYAWLGLGETDSVKLFAGLAIMINPSHPEARVLNGLMEEMNGDPEKATHEYLESMEHSINPLTEQLLKNKGQQGKIDNLDFEKIKKSIAIYEYFQFCPIEHSMPLPPLFTSVSSDVSNYSIQEGYKKMMVELSDEIEKKNDLLGTNVKENAAGDEKNFIQLMGWKNAYGLRLMTKPAVIVMRVLFNYGKQWHLKLSDEWNAMLTQIARYKKEMEEITLKPWPDKMSEQQEKEECDHRDEAKNRFMRLVNPMIRKFYIYKAEELRQWTNAYITWNQHLTLNIKNTIIMEDNVLALWLVQMYASAVIEQVLEFKTCRGSTDRPITKIPMPELPNFKCPATVSIPVGPDWQELTAATNFDDNDYNVKQTNKPIPNVSVAQGIGNMVSQPGIAPSVKTANGSASVSQADVNAAIDDRLEELLSDSRVRDINEETEMLENIRKDKVSEVKHDMQKVKLVKELLKKMMTADCKRIKEKKKYLEEIANKSMEMDIESDNAEKKALEELRTNGLQPSISSGAQAPGTFSPIKTLFK